MDFVRTIENRILSAFRQTELLINRFDRLKSPLRIFPMGHAILSALLDEDSARADQRNNISVIEQLEVPREKGVVLRSFNESRVIRRRPNHLWHQVIEMPRDGAGANSLVQGRQIHRGATAPRNPIRAN